MASPMCRTAELGPSVQAAQMQGDRVASVLVVEDDVETADYIRNGLGQRGYTVDVANDGPTGLSMARTNLHDVLVLDRMLPHLDGVTLLRRLRLQGHAARALFLTARGAVSDRIEGLDAGADDYLVKPFDMGELDARLSALLRRPSLADANRDVRVADMRIDRISRRVWRGGEMIPLQTREYQLLECLALNAGRLVTRAMLLESVWQIRFDPGTNIVETHMSRLRSKIDKPGTPSLVRTVRGAGYVAFA